MIRLETLKDLTPKEINDSLNNVSFMDIRKTMGYSLALQDTRILVIKWIKELQKVGCYDSEINGMPIYNMPSECDESGAMINVLKEIFNITDKDLD